MKMCRKCDSQLPISEFSKSSATADGLQRWCKSCCKISRRERYVKNKEQEIASARQWHSKNSAEWSKYMAEYRATHRSELRQQARHYHHVKYRTDLQYRQHCREKTKAWYRKNPDKVYTQRVKRRLRRKLAFVEVVRRMKVWKRDGGVCKICNVPVEFETMHLDHIVPLAHGGEHSYANVQVSCAPCNLRKGAKTA